MGVSRKNYYKNTLVYMAYESSYWNKSFSTQISLELLAICRSRKNAIQSGGTLWPRTQRILLIC
jgi:hypothetical protein